MKIRGHMFVESVRKLLTELREEVERLGSGDARRYEICRWKTAASRCWRTCARKARCCCRTTSFTRLLEKTQAASCRWRCRGTALAVVGGIIVMATNIAVLDITAGSCRRRPTLAGGGSSSAAASGARVPRGLIQGKSSSKKDIKLKLSDKLNIIYEQIDASFADFLLVESASSTCSPWRSGLHRNRQGIQRACGALAPSRAFAAAGANWEAIGETGEPDSFGAARPGGVRPGRLRCAVAWGAAGGGAGGYRVRAAGCGRCGLYVGPRRRHEQTAAALRRGRGGRGFAKFSQAAAGFDEFPFQAILLAAAERDGGREMKTAARRSAARDPLRERRSFDRLFMRAMTHWQAGGSMPRCRSCSPTSGAGCAARLHAVIAAQGRGKSWVAIVTSAGPMAAAVQLGLVLPDAMMLKLCAVLANTALVELRHRRHRSGGGKRQI